MAGTTKLRSGLHVAACLLLLWVPTGARGQASPYVPVLDEAYRDLDALAARGYVREVVQAQRPYSRMAFARFAVEARAALGSAERGVAKARFVDAVERLERQFAVELGLLCGEDRCAPAAPSLALREALLEGTWADSPPRDMPTAHSPWPHIDATLNPLLQGNQGRILVDGGTLAAEALADVTLGSVVAGQLRPRVWIAAPDAGGTDVDATLVGGYLRAVAGSFAVEVGRNHVPHGYGPGSGPMVSTNARGMDMVRLSMERPARLPWILRELGPVSVSGYVADMGGEREFPHSKLIILEGNIRPHPNLELGGVLLNHQGGEGAPPATLWERIVDVFGYLDWSSYGGYRAISDKAVGLDGKLTLPGPGLEMSLSFATTDINVPNPNTYGFNAIWQAGLRLVGLGPSGRVDLWMEGSRTGAEPHTHGQYTSGLTLDRAVIGQPMGPLTSGLRFGAYWRGTASALSVSGAMERYRGDKFEGNGLTDVDFRWILVEDNPDEIRLRAAVDWTRYPGSAGLRTTVRMGYEHVTRFDFTDENRSNFLTQVRFAYVW